MLWLHIAPRYGTGRHQGAKTLPEPHALARRTAPGMLRSDHVQVKISGVQVRPALAVPWGHGVTLGKQEVEHHVLAQAF